MLRNVILMVLAICVLTACNQAGPAQPKVGIVDTAKVFRECEPAKAGVKFLEAVQTDLQKQLSDLQEKIQQDPTNAALQQEIQNKYAEFQQRIGAEEQNVVNLLQDALQRTVDAQRVGKKLELVVGTEVALAYDKSIDITDEVIAEMNKQSIEFKSILPEELAPAAMEPQAPAATSGAATPKAATPEAATPAATEAEKTPEAATPATPEAEKAPEAEKK